MHASRFLKFLKGNGKVFVGKSELERGRRMRTAQKWTKFVDGNVNMNHSKNNNLLAVW